jgi:hypothetical protein
MSRAKYHNVVQGGFDSKKEARVYQELQMRMYAHLPALRVTSIDRQVRFELLPRQNGADGKLIERAVTYVADFVVQYADGRREVIDAKSDFTRKLPVYILKRKLMLYRHGLRVIEI